MMYANVEKDLAALEKELIEFTYNYNAAEACLKNPSLQSMKKMAEAHMATYPGLIAIINRQIEILGRIKTKQPVMKEELNVLTEKVNEADYLIFPEYRDYVAPSMLPASSVEPAGPSVPASSASSSSHAPTFFRTKSLRNLKHKLFRH